ncbi:MAG: hypothetical protein ETSY2_32330 [Candidatus Entotheonella gemina]|uniref:Uncharacterized protein n=1 Tax=Candidatus Entotheonella gemina TaxID=1429439 RepID=W4M0X7_9BACT|nr:MAG: hypothetical protein ETSY2_32330 [Candidatus Entotheonella gemina]
MIRYQKKNRFPKCMGISHFIHNIRFLAGYICYYKIGTADLILYDFRNFSSINIRLIYTKYHDSKFFQHIFDEKIYFFIFPKKWAANKALPRTMNYVFNY